MNSPEQLQNMMSNTATKLDIQPKTVIDAYPLCYRIQNRKMFSEYCSISGYKSVAPKIENYFQELNVPAISSTSAQRIKTVLLKNINRNYHTEALLSGAAQAYFDLCMFMGITGICTRTNELNYNQAIIAIEKSLDLLEENYVETCRVLNQLETGDMFKDFENVLNFQIDFISLKRFFQKTVQIIKLYQEDRIRYDQSYESVEDSIDNCIQDIDNELFFSHVVTVLRNKSDFTQEQIDFIDETYSNRFTNQQKANFKQNVPDQTPSVEETKAYFFKSTEKKSSSIFDVDFGAVAK